MLEGGDADAPLDVQEEFWVNVLAFEGGSIRSQCVRDILAEDGVQPAPSDELTDESLPDHLQNLIEALARRGMFLSQTDHLSDRELYTLLVDQVLEEDTDVFPPGSGWFTHIFGSDYVAPDGQDSTRLYLRYYADPDARERWAREFPDDPMPPHQEPPYDRDHGLPGAPGC